MQGRFVSVKVFLFFLFAPILGMAEERPYCRYFSAATPKVINFVGTQSKKESWPLYTFRTGNQYVPTGTFLDLEIKNRGERTTITLKVRRHPSEKIAIPYNLLGVYFEVENNSLGKVIRHKDFDFTRGCTTDALNLLPGQAVSVTETEIEVTPDHSYFISISSQGGE